MSHLSAVGVRKVDFDDDVEEDSKMGENLRSKHTISSMGPFFS